MSERRPQPTGRHPALRGAVFVPGPLADRLTDLRCLGVITVGLTAVYWPALVIPLIFGIIVTSMCLHWDTWRRIGGL